MENRVKEIPGDVEIRNVLISVSEKSSLRFFVEGMKEIIPNVSIYSTGGTYNAISDILGTGKKGILKKVSEYTGQPEMQGGLVKTLDYKIYLGILSEPYNVHHDSDLQRTDAVKFDMIVVNLYPFRETIASSGITLEDARAYIDIGGPCMLRASAKNFLRVASVCDPDDYSLVISELKKRSGKLSLATRFYLAKKAFTHTAEYDAEIAGYLQKLNYTEAVACYFEKE